MARFYRRKRFARRLRRAFRGKKTSMARIKKDIMKCNFPTKVKFMGLTEKKVMFLTEVRDMNLDNSATEILLNPLNAGNIASILNTTTMYVQGENQAQQYKKVFSNWDKICILGIYIKFQPKKNTWIATNGTADITQVFCTYNQSNVDMTPVTVVNQNNQNPSAYGPSNYDADARYLKQQFIFNSNEAFTMYIPAPPTMSSADPSVHKSKSWWSLINIKPNIVGNNYINDENDESDRDDELPILDAVGPIQPGGLVNDARPYIHAGRLFIGAEGPASYNITINYKVALKG